MYTMETLIRNYKIYFKILNEVYNNWNEKYTGGELAAD